MLDNTFTAPSGAEVQIKEAPFEESFALKNAIVSEISKSKLNVMVDVAGGAMDMKEIELSQFVAVALSIDTSKPVYEALFKCLARSTYNGSKIQVQTFEPSEARKDYYIIAETCIKVNLAPFWEGLRSQLAPIIQTLVSLGALSRIEKSPK